MSVEVKGLAEAIRTLNKVEPGLRRVMTREIRDAVRPLVEDINNSIPAGAPLSGMNHNGRTGWKRRRTVVIKVDARKPRRHVNRPNYSTLSVVRVGTRDAPTAIVDMAGKAGGSSSRARPGRARPNFSGALGGTASRFMWPAADRNLGSIERNLEDITKRIQFEANKELMKVYR